MDARSSETFERLSRAGAKRCAPLLDRTHPIRYPRSPVLTSSIAKVSRSLVFLEIAKYGGEELCGTGFAVSAAGLVATAQHLVVGARRIQASLLGGRGTYRCEIVAAEKRTDLALLRVEKEGCRPVALYRGDPVAIGREVAFVGFPYADIFKPPLAMATRGIVGNRYALGEVEYYVVDAMCAEGMSGGPLFLAETGEVIGLVGSRFDPSRTRAKLRGLPEAVVDGLPKERTNLTFATAVEYLSALVSKHDAP